MTDEELIEALYAMAPDTIGRAAAYRIESLRGALRAAFEVWAGSDGVPLPLSPREAYLMRLIEQMRAEIRAALGPPA